MPTVRPDPERDFGGVVGIHELAFADGRSRCTLDVEPRHYNPNGVLHGGVSFTLADVGMGSAVFSSLGPGQRTTAVEVQVRFLRTVTGGRLTAESEIVSRHDRIALARSEIRDGQGRLVAIATGTFYVTPAPTEDGS